MLNGTKTFLGIITRSLYSGVSATPGAIECPDSDPIAEDLALHELPSSFSRTASEGDASIYLGGHGVR